MPFPKSLLGVLLLANYPMKINYFLNFIQHRLLFTSNRTLMHLKGHLHLSILPIYTVFNTITPCTGNKGESF